MPEETLVQRVPPHSEEAEQSVLGAILIDPESVETACGILVSDDFYNKRHQEVFRGVTNLFTKGQRVDIVTLKSELERLGTLEVVGGTRYLGQLSAVVPSSYNIQEYAQIVKEKALFRRYIRLGNEILAKGYSQEEDLESISNMVESEVYAIMDKRGEQDFKQISDVLLEAFNRLELLSQNGGQIQGVPTGFIDLDKKLYGLHGSDLIIIGARASMGKTAFALNMVQHAAVHEGKSCAVFSLEMSAQQLVNRMMAVEGGVNLEKFMNGDLKEEDWSKLGEALGALSKAKIFIDDNSAITLPEIRSKCRKLKNEVGLDLIMIDYLQLMNSSGRRSENRQQEISEFSRGLKLLARELDVPVLALSQLSRNLETRKDKRPMMSDLRESGAIEQDADVILFIYRDEFYQEDSPDLGKAEIIIAKHRNGETGKVTLHYDGRFTRFGNLAMSPESRYDAHY